MRRRRSCSRKVRPPPRRKQRQRPRTSRTPESAGAMAVGGKLARALRLLPLAVLGTALVPWPAPAQTSDAWPSRPLRFILPFPPGGGTDILGRLIAERLAANLGQPVVTENRGGAGGNVGAEAAARSAPDGYTIVLVAPSLAISKTLYSKLNYDPVKDFAPVSLVATVPNVMVTHPSVPAATLAEFIRLAKTKPGEMNFGSGGSGTSNHLAGELFNIVAGVKLVHVPYKGVNLAMNDVLSGQIHLVVIGVPAAAPHIKAGKLRALALVAPQRAAALPEVPTAAEAGLPNFEVTTWYGILAPAGTPKAIVTRLNAELVKTMHAPDLKDRLAAMANDPATSSPLGMGLLKKKPCISSQARSRRKVCCSCVSTPSATTVRLRLLPMAMIASVSALSSAFCGRSRMNERSTLSVSIGKRFRCVSEE